MHQIHYITLSDAIEIHKRTIQNSGGGAFGQLDVGKLDAVLCHVQNDDYYPSFADKLTHLFFCTCEFHCFEDGNKRLAIALVAQFLLLNGYMSVAKTFFTSMENISYHVAAGRIKKELLGKIMLSILDFSFDHNEELALEIFRAISE